MKNDFRNYCELEHSGINGMKWGVRRYQYEDGSLTPEGKIRYKKTGKVGTKKQPPTHEQLLNSRNPNEVWKYKDQLSDQELQQRINRLNMEQNLYSIKEKYNSRAYDKGMKVAKAIVATVGTATALAIAVKKVRDWGITVDSNTSEMILNQLNNSFAHSDDDSESITVGDIPISALRA